MEICVNALFIAGEAGHVIWLYDFIIKINCTMLTYVNLLVNAYLHLNLHIYVSLEKYACGSLIRYSLDINKLQFSPSIKISFNTRYNF